MQGVLAGTHAVPLGLRRTAHSTLSRQSSRPSRQSRRSVVVRAAQKTRVVRGKCYVTKDVSSSAMSSLSKSQRMCSIMKLVVAEHRYGSNHPCRVPDTRPFQGKHGKVELCCYSAHNYNQLCYIFCKHGCRKMSMRSLVATHLLDCQQSYIRQGKFSATSHKCFRPIYNELMLAEFSF